MCGGGLAIYLINANNINVFIDKKPIIKSVTILFSSHGPSSWRAIVNKDNWNGASKKSGMGDGEKLKERKEGGMGLLISVIISRQYNVREFKD